MKINNSRLLDEANEVAIKIMKNNEVIKRVKKDLKNGKNIFDIPNYSDGVIAEIKNGVMFLYWRDLWERYLKLYPNKENEKLYWQVVLLSYNYYLLNP